MKTAIAPIAGVLLLSLATVTTSVSHAEENPAPVETTAPLTLPAEGISITDTNGREITATVLSRNRNGITIRMADGKEHHIAWKRLSAGTVQEIMGQHSPMHNAAAHRERVRLDQQRQAAEKAAARAAAIKAREENFNKIVRIQNLAVAANKKIRWGDPKELHRLFIEKDQSVQAILDCFGMYVEKALSSPNAVPIRENILNYYDVEKEIDVRKEEKVSLRDEVERLGVTLRHQESKLCSIYASYHIAQYAHLAARLNPPSVGQVKSLLTPKELAETQTLDNSPITILHRMGRARPNGKSMKVLWMRAPTENLTEELVKHQLRNGKLCVMTIWEVIGQGSGRHSIVVVGFQTKEDGTTEWEYLNSNNVGGEDGGYVKKSGTIFLNRGLGNDGISIWFE